MEKDRSPRDPLRRLTRQLDQARGGLVTLRAENEALRRRAGVAPAMCPPDQPAARAGQRPSVSAYRAEDPRRRLEREVAEAHAEVARLSIDNEILRARAQPRPRVSARALRGGGIVVGAAALAGGAWVLTENLGVLILIAILGAVWWTVVALMDRIPPDQDAPKMPRWPM